MEHEFTIILAVDKCDESLADILVLLCGAGFTDVSVGVGQPWRSNFSHEPA